MLNLATDMGLSCFHQILKPALMRIWQSSAFARPQGHTKLD